MCVSFLMNCNTQGKHSQIYFWGTGTCSCSVGPLLFLQWPRLEQLMQQSIFLVGNVLFKEQTELLQWPGQIYFLDLFVDLELEHYKHVMFQAWHDVVGGFFSPLFCTGSHSVQTCLKDLAIISLQMSFKTQPGLEPVALGLHVTFRRTYCILS